jgi:hypothetical protein
VEGAYNLISGGLIHLLCGLDDAPTDSSPNTLRRSRFEVALAGAAAAEHPISIDKLPSKSDALSARGTENSGCPIPGISSGASSSLTSFRVKRSLSGNWQ